MPLSADELTICEAAERLLQEVRVPTHIREMRRLIEERGYFKFGAKDPDRVLGVQVDRHSKGVQISHAASPQLFYRASPATYGLLEWLTAEQVEDLEIDVKITESAEREALDSTLFLERELHQWLYKNLRENGLKAFGYGHLTEFNPQSQLENIGKFQTGVVGEMDMLLRTPTNDIVILELKRRADDQTIGQICRYFGYAKEHLCSPGKQVYGLILAQEISTSLRYALRAVSSEIRVRQLHFEVKLGDPWP
jgi:hypothetical protein